MSRTTASSSCRCLSSMSSVRIKPRCANELIVWRLTSAIGIVDIRHGGGGGVIDRQRTQATDRRDPGGDVTAGKAMDNRYVQSALPLGQCLFFERSERSPRNPDPEPADLLQSRIPRPRLRPRSSWQRAGREAA